MQSIKQLKSLLALLALVLLTQTAAAADFEVDGLCYNITSVTTVEVASNGYSGDIVIPELVSYEGKTYSVTGIGDHAFDYCGSLISVNIPNSVTSIGNYAFGACHKLSRIESYPNPADVTMGEYVFIETPKGGRLHVLPQYLDAYQSADQWRDFYNIKGDLGQPTPGDVIGDVTGDGKVDIADVNFIISIMLNK